MESVQCINCKEIIKVKEIKKGTEVTCVCGCQQRCLDIDEYISRWRVTNPFSFDDKR